MSVVTILDLAKFRGAVADENGGINGAEFEKVGLPFIGGCGVCEATIAAYNACPSKSGFLCCANGCIEQVGGWDDVAECNRDLFGETRWEISVLIGPCRQSDAEALMIELADYLNGKKDETGTDLGAALSARPWKEEGDS